MDGGHSGTERTGDGGTGVEEEPADHRDVVGRDDRPIDDERTVVTKPGDLLPGERYWT